MPNGPLSHSQVIFADGLALFYTMQFAGSPRVPCSADLSPNEQEACLIEDRAHSNRLEIPLQYRRMAPVSPLRVAHSPISLMRLEPPEFAIGQQFMPLGTVIFEPTRQFRRNSTMTEQPETYSANSQHPNWNPENTWIQSLKE